MLLDKSDASRSEIIRIIEAMGLVTNMCLQMGIDLSCKLLNNMPLLFLILMYSIFILFYNIYELNFNYVIGKNVIYTYKMLTQIYVNMPLIEVLVQYF